MNIWDAYCNPDYYNVYFEFLKAKGIKAEEVEELKEQFTTYIQRIKGTRFKMDLKKITTREGFLAKLDEIFNVKWEGHIKYQSMPHHYMRYLDFLDTMQVLHKDFINDEEKCRLINPDFDIPIAELTKYEEEYMVDGKLKALANPQLIYILKDFIDNSEMNPHKLTLVCEDFYGGLLPAMEPEDYRKLLEMHWYSSRGVKKGGKRNKIKVTFPDGCIELYSISDAVVQIVSFYGFEECFKFKPQIRSNPVLVKYIPYGQEKFYREMGPLQYFRFDGNYKDFLQALRMINIHFGSKLKIELH